MDSLEALHGFGFQPSYGKPYKQGEIAPRDLLFACGGSMAARRDVFLACGGFDEDYFAFFEDIDLGWRLWVLGYEVVFVPSSVAYPRLVDPIWIAGAWVGRGTVLVGDRSGKSCLRLSIRRVRWADSKRIMFRRNAISTRIEPDGRIL